MEHHTDTGAKRKPPADQHALFEPIRGPAWAWLTQDGGPTADETPAAASPAKSAAATGADNRGSFCTSLALDGTEREHLLAALEIALAVCRGDLGGAIGAISLARAAYAPGVLEAALEPLADRLFAAGLPVRLPGPAVLTAVGR